MATKMEEQRPENNNQNNNQGFSLDMSNLGSQQALYEHEQNMYNTTGAPTNGTFDRLADTRIRLAIIENYTIEKNNEEEVDPLNIDYTINMKNGKVVIKWVDYKGGMIRSEKFAYPNQGYTEPWTYYPENDSKYPEDRTLDCYNHDKASDREMLQLSHAFIWSNSSNWCGMNYLPPVGSIVIVGFKKNNIPVILGYAPNNYDVYKPYLKPGETMIKGYGNNYIHWRWSDKLDLHVSSMANQIDIDDPYKQDKYLNNLDMWMRFDAFTRNIIISVKQKDSNDQRKTIIELKPEIASITSEDITGKKKSTVMISSNDVYAYSNDESNNKTSNIYLTNDSLSIKTTGDININADGNINLKGSQINLN